MMTERERRQDLYLNLVLASGLIATLIGVVGLGSTTIGADPVAALASIGAQLPTTLPAALLMVGATAINLAAGGLLARAVAGAPFSGLAQAALAGLAGAVVLDALLMVTLGSLGLFSWLPLILAHAAALAAAPWLRPFTAARPTFRWSPRSFPLAWLLILLVWSGPIALQLASPVVPFLDVLPNHVAPVEHLRSFAGLESLDTSPTPIYGPSRIFLGYQASLGVLATLAGVAAPLAVAAFCLPLTLLVGAAAFGLARAVGGRQAGMWALLLVPLSVTFLRLADARAGVLAFPLAALALWLMIEPLGTTPRRQAAVLCAVLAAAMFVHPLIGLLATGPVGLMGLVGLVRRTPTALPGLPAAVAAPVIALPQWAAMAGLDLPPWSALLALPLGVAALVGAEAAVRRVVATGFELPRLRARAADNRVGVVTAVCAGALALLGLLWVLDPAAVGRIGGGPVSMLAQYPVLLGGGVLALLVAARRPGMELLYGTLLAVVLAALATGLAPTGTVIGDALRFEVPKTLAYFAPTILAIAGAVGMAELWRRAGWPLAARVALAAVLLLGAALPLRTEVVEALSLGEHRLSESLSISLRNAQHGYWQGFPDSRRLVNAEQQEVLDALRVEIDARRITARTPVLHVARSFQPWASIPLAVFTGVMETTATLDPERSIHTEGGRLLDVADLPALLAADYPYVVLEPAGLEAGLEAAIEAAGYRPIFANQRAVLFERLARLGE